MEGKSPNNKRIIIKFADNTYAHGLKDNEIESITSDQNQPDYGAFENQYDEIDEIRLFIDVNFLDVDSQLASLYNRHRIIYLIYMIVFFLLECGVTIFSVFTIPDDYDKHDFRIYLYYGLLSCNMGFSLVCTILAVISYMLEKLTVLKALEYICIAFGASKLVFLFVTRWHLVMLIIAMIAYEYSVFLLSLMATIISLVLERNR